MIERDNRLIESGMITIQELRWDDYDRIISQMTEWVLLPRWDDYDRIMSQMTEWVLLPRRDDYDRIMSQMTEWVLLPDGMIMTGL